MICGKGDVWPREKYSLEGTSSYSWSKEEEASVLFIENPHLVTMALFEIFIYMYDKIRPIMLLSQWGFTEWTEWKPISQCKL